LEQEEALALKVEGYKSIAAEKPHLKGFYKTKSSTGPDGILKQSKYSSNSSAVVSTPSSSNNKTSSPELLQQQEVHLPEKQVNHLSLHHHRRYSHVSHHEGHLPAISQTHSGVPVSYLPSSDTYHYVGKNKSEGKHAHHASSENLHSWSDSPPKPEDQSVHSTSYHSSFSSISTSPTSSTSHFNLLKSLAKLENEKKLLDLVAATSPPVAPSFSKEEEKVDSYTFIPPSPAVVFQKGFDDIACADMFIDKEVLSHSALVNTSHSFPPASSSTDDTSSISNSPDVYPFFDEELAAINPSYSSLPPQDNSIAFPVKPSNLFNLPIGLEVDLNKLNQIHFFADYNTDLKELENVLGVCFLKDKKTGKPLFQKENTSFSSLSSSSSSFSSSSSSDVSPSSSTTSPSSTDSTFSSPSASPPASSSTSASSSPHSVLSQPLLVIIRHGKTEHNQLGLFTGWEDALLAEEGREEAIHAGKVLKAHSIEFDVIYTSWLSRAIETAWIVMNELDSLWLPIVKTWRLNERMYGGLTGLSKKMIRQIYGDEQFMKWRRGYDTPPPPISSFSQACKTFLSSLLAPLSSFRFLFSLLFAPFSA
jgi:hypothetical protein